MKVRSGFVSNSSSTSFMAGIPKGMTKKETREFLVKKIGGINPTPFVFKVVKDMADCILRSKRIRTKEQLAKEFYCASFDEMLKSEDSDRYHAEFFLKCEKKNLDFYCGDAGNGSEGESSGEIAFFDIKCKINDDDFLFIKEQNSC